jgi:sugar-specific transcriptional regulator TrmB
MKTKIDRNLQNFLEDFGLSEREILLYLTLLRTGPNTIMNLARETAIKRSTTHNNVEELIKKGLVSQTNYGERRMVIAEDPEKLKFLMEQKKYNIKKLEENLPSVIGVINSLVPEARENTKVEVKYYQGDKAVFYVYELSLKADEVYSFADLDRYYEIYPDTTDLWKKAFEDNKKREVWDLIVDSKLSRSIVDDKHPRYHVKYLPSSEFFQGFEFADYIIFDNKVAIIQLKAEETVATVIDSAPMAMSLKALHKSMWELLK